MLSNQVAHLRTIAAYKSVEELEKNHYLHHLDRLTQNDAYKENVLPCIIKKLEGLLVNEKIDTEGQYTIQDAIQRLEGYREFVEERMYIERHHLILKIKKTHVDEIIYRSVNDCDKLDIQLQLAIHNHAKQKILTCDADKIVRLLTNSMQFITNHGMHNAEGIVNIHIADTKINYVMHARDGGSDKVLPALAFVITTSSEMPEIQTVYEDLLDIMTPTVVNTTNDLYKKDMIRIIDAHYGCFLSDKSDKNISFSYILPVILNELRDRVMDEIPRSCDFKIQETAVSVVQERALEDLLVKETLLERSFIAETIQFIKKCHWDQTRKSGEPFYIHPMSVAEILLVETKDPDAVIAALLHDVIEDSKVPLSYIKARFGRDVAFIVDKVTHMGSTFRKKKLSKEENEALLCTCKNVDIRPIQVKLSDRLDNVRTLKYVPIAQQIRVAKQTLVVYIPFAESIGVTKLTAEMRARCEEILKKYAKECN